MHPKTALSLSGAQVILSGVHPSPARPKTESIADSCAGSTDWSCEILPMHRGDLRLIRRKPSTGNGGDRACCHGRYADHWSEVHRPRRRFRPCVTGVSAGIRLSCLCKHRDPGPFPRSRTPVPAVQSAPRPAGTSCRAARKRRRGSASAWPGRREGS